MAGLVICDACNRADSACLCTGGAWHVAAVELEVSEWLRSAADSNGRLRGNPRLVYYSYLKSLSPRGLPDPPFSPEWMEDLLRELHNLGVIRLERGPERDAYSGQPLLMIQVENWESVRPRRAPIPDEVRSAVYDRDDRRCVHCGATDDLSLDHIQPWSKGGSDEINNLQTLCRPCNSSKNDKWEASCA